MDTLNGSLFSFLFFGKDFRPIVEEEQDTPLHRKKRIFSPLLGGGGPFLCLFDGGQRLLPAAISQRVRREGKRAVKRTLQEGTKIERQENFFLLLPCCPGAKERSLQQKLSLASSYYFRSALRVLR